MAVVYNEIEPFAAAWLRNLILAGLIAPGEVDTRSIEDVAPDDYRQFRQVHLFAGIGLWSHAARAAGIADDDEFWSASCPCQPFSAAGQGMGFADERHLWPAAFHLIDCLRPKRIAGEQVASADGRAWLDLVQDDMEGAGYAFGAVGLVSCGFGAPNIRQRLYWKACADQSEWGWWPREGAGNDRHGPQAGRVQDPGYAERRGELGGVEQPDGSRSQGGPLGAPPERERFAVSGGAYGLADAHEQQRTGATNGFWSAADWLLCRDPDGPRWRPVEPGTFPLAARNPSRVASIRANLLRAYGNAINAEVATEFLKARP